MANAPICRKCKIPFTKDTVKEEIRADTAAKLGIAECLNQHPFDLSGGQAQKLAFGYSFRTRCRYFSFG